MFSLTATTAFGYGKRHRATAFTLVEVMVSTLLIAVVVATVIWGLTVLDRRATVNRLYTQAQTICQNRIDTILTVGPYNPSSNPPALPDELKTTQTPQTVAISTAPGNPVSGTMTTTIVDTNLKYPDSTGTLLNIKQAKVVVDYKFRGDSYSVEMNTMRAPDQ
jgi:type II secretory pathway pseudopilin PulG